MVTAYEMQVSDVKREESTDGIMDKVNACAIGLSPWEVDLSVWFGVTATPTQRLKEVAVAQSVVAMMPMLPEPETRISIRAPTNDERPSPGHHQTYSRPSCIVPTL